MSFKDLRLADAPERNKGDKAIYLGNELIGHCADLTSEDNGSWVLEGVIITRGPGRDYILAIEFEAVKDELMVNGTVTATFTKAIAKLMGRSGKGFRSRFYRGFYEGKHGGVYDAAGLLIYDDSIHTRAGEMMNYPTHISKIACSVIRRFAVIAKRKKRGRFPR